ncbi:polysaccharide ABC transporter substrate-binding protein [Paenibacillus pini JCM 16418]|uniref:Polysaccharide ABC transporter substrate-binding protein n=2 Tax=Paenibacillus TaxID=44249 RepID=W7Z316_9BACL|nr:polysaccharide ABC transporter substrate-binding protein [Paenibacillus pini JCM 16418]
MKADTKIQKMISEKTGVEFEYMPVIGGADQAKQKYEIWLASEDYPDIVNMGVDNISKYRDGGALQPMEDLIDQYGPNIKKKFGKFYDLLRDKDGHIYSLGNVNLSKETPANVQGSFVVQYDVLKEAGYPQIKTLDQLFDVLQAYVTKHPTMDGKETIAFSGAGADLTYNNPSVNAAGLPDHGRFSIDSDNNVHVALTSDYTKKYYGFLNKLQNAGMLDKEIFSLNYETASTKLAQGRILAGFFPQWVLGGPESSLIAAGKTDREFAKFPLYFDENVQDHSNTVTPSSSGNNWAITKNAKHPERIIQYLDYLFTDEGQKLISWGIEGQHYDVVEGKRVRKEEVNNQIKGDPDYLINEGLASSNSMFSFGDGAKLDDGDYATPLTADAIAGNYDDATKDILKKYNKKIWADFLAKPEYIPAYLWQLNAPEKSTAIMKKMEQAWQKETPKMILAKTQGEFDAAWNSYVGQLDQAGLKNLEQMWTEKWKQYIEVYNKATQK